MTNVYAFEVSAEEKEYMHGHDLVVDGPMDIGDFLNAIRNFKSVTVRE